MSLAHQRASAAPALGGSGFTTQSGLRVTASRNFEHFRDHWPSLERKGEARCHVFQSAEFIRIWIDTIGSARGTQPFFVMASTASGEPVMLLALGIERRFGLRSLCFLDGAVSDYNQPVLFPPACDIDDRAMVALWRDILAALPRVDLVEFKKLPEKVEDLLNPLLRLGATRSAESGHYARLRNVGDGVAPPGRDSNRRKRKRLGKLGPVELEVATEPQRAAEILEALLAMKARRFTETRVPGLEDAPGALEFYREATRRLASPGQVCVCALSCGGEIVAAQWGLAFADRFYLLVLGHEAGPWRPFSPGHLIASDLMGWAHEAGYARFDFGVGDEGYKDAYCDAQIALHNLHAPLTLAGSLSLGLKRARKAARRTSIYARLRPWKWAITRALRAWMSR